MVYISFGTHVHLLVEPINIIWGNDESEVVVLSHELVNGGERNYEIFMARKKIVFRVDDRLVWVLEYFRACQPFSGKAFQEFSGQNRIGIMVYLATGVDHSHENVLGFGGLERRREIVVIKIIAAAAAAMPSFLQFFAFRDMVVVVAVVVNTIG